MGALNWIRVATRAVGLRTPQAYPHLEALLESLEELPDNDYRLMARLMPPIFGTAIGVMVGLACQHVVPLLIVGELANAGAMYGLWFGLDKADKSIPRSLKNLRKTAQPVWERYRGLGNLAGVAPALFPAVAEVLDEASAIYLKHTADREARRAMFGDSYLKAQQALEGAMARMLDLATPPTIQQQELALNAGWAYSLLQEMRDMDVALSTPRPSVSTDPVANLRAARLEIQGIESAIDELEETQSSR